MWNATCKYPTRWNDMMCKMMSRRSQHQARHTIALQQPCTLFY